MANPQTENGFTKIANELLDALCAIQLSGHEWKIVHTVIRKTYGYNKKEDWIAGSQITELTGLPKRRVNEAKKKLLEKNIIIKDGLKLSLNKDYDDWGKVTEKRYPGNGKALPKVTENRPHKRKKDNIQKKSAKAESNDMSWNKHSDEFEEGVVNYDSGELESLEEKKPPAPSRKRMDELVNWLIEYQGRDKLRTNRPKQYKALKELVKMQVTGKEAQQIIMEAMQDEFWKGKKEKPDFSTVVSIIQKRG